MQWKADVSNDDIEAVNASSTTKIKHGSTSYLQTQEVKQLKFLVQTQLKITNEVLQ